MKQAPAGKAGSFVSAELLQTSPRLPAQEGGDIKMVVALWRRRNSCGAAVDVQPLRRRPPGVLRYRFMGCDLLAGGALRFPLGQRRHRRTRGAGRGPRLGLFPTG